MQSLITNNLLDINIKSRAFTVYETISLKPISDAFIKNIMCNWDKISTHGIRDFDIGEPHNPKYYTYIYVNKTTRRLIKLFNYTNSELADFIIIREIAYQMYAEQCSLFKNYTVPHIYNYGKIIITDDVLKQEFKFNTCMFIEMELSSFTPLKHILNTVELTTPVCTAISNKLNIVYNELISDGIFHNDYHSENILMKIDKLSDIKVMVVDFGNASNTYTSFTDWSYSIDKLKGIKDAYYSKECSKYLCSLCDTAEEPDLNVDVLLNENKKTYTIFERFFLLCSKRRKY